MVTLKENTIFYSGQANRLRLPSSEFSRKNRIHFIFVAFILVFTPYLNAQEKLRALTENTQVQTASKQKQYKLKSASAQSLQLPFIDDFSSTSVFPDPALWADKNVFINSSFGVNPKTIGVASFDIFDAEGKIYKNAKSEGFGADTLTSNPINLYFPEGSNIWLSFYIQPGGLGDVPDVKDSLKLQFYSPLTGKWKEVWITPGFPSPTTFTYKSVPVNDTQYLRDGFRFRFINLASLTTSDIIGKTSIPDMWNVDYVKLDTGRNENDSIYHDVAMVKTMTSLLKTYNSMPWSHYLFAFINEIKPQIEMTFKVYDPDGRTVDRRFSFKELSAKPQTIDSIDIGAEKNQTWENITVQADLTNPFKSKNTDSAVYEVRSYIGVKDKDIVYRKNDTAKFIQVFKDYFAYDDGTAESSYGVSGQGTQNAEVAYGFYSYFPDTLRSIGILFNPTQNSATDSLYFRLSVWDNNNGKPGNQIYRDVWERQPLAKNRNEFVYYPLDSGILVNETFFVGWEQSSEDYLNIGYDLNSPNGQRFLYYNITGIWEKSGTSGTVTPGSLMIRPVMRSIKNSVSAPIIKEKPAIGIFPNPATIYISVSNASETTDKVSRITFFNLLGQPVKTVDFPEGDIDISELKPELYIVKIQTKKGNSETIKLLKEM